MTLRVTAIPIVQKLDPRCLEGLSAEAAEAADEDGYLDGNQHYQDLRAFTWDDVRHTLQRESGLIAALVSAPDPAAAERELYESRDPYDDRESLWNLDVGVAAAVVALSALGAHTTLSCNGGAFGGTHARDTPCVRFFPGKASIDLVLQLAREADVGLVEEEGRALLYGRSVLDLQRFAAAALKVGQSG